MIASDRSPSFFETLSAGQSVDPVYEDRGMRRNRNRSMTRLQAATNQNAIMQENLIQFMDHTDYVPELMYQHVQFRRTEKFMKNYIDQGSVITQKMAQNSDKMLQEIQYLDESIFRGEVLQDEETKQICKEGQGLFQRPEAHNQCFYSRIGGNWSRGILHGKRIEFAMNLGTFPMGYYAGYSSKRGSVPVSNLNFIYEMKKGIQNGPATISINNKKVCRTNFSDQIEFVKSTNHPVGRQNLISTDRAFLNFILVFLSIACLVMVLVMPDMKIVWIIVSTVLYTLQMLEVFMSQTTQLLWQENGWDDLDLFHQWFYELKKCRPVLTFSFTPMEEHKTILCDLNNKEQTLANLYEELRQIRQ